MLQRRPAYGEVAARCRGALRWSHWSGGPRAAAFFASRTDAHSMKTKTALTAGNLTPGNLTPNPLFSGPRGNGNNHGEEITQMNGSPLLNRANVFEAGLFSWGIPEETARELTRNHSELNYSPNKLIFSQGSPADIVLWVVKGVV